MQQLASAGKLNPDGQLSVPHLRPSWQSLSELQSPLPSSHGDLGVQQFPSYGAVFEHFSWQVVNSSGMYMATTLFRGYIVF